MLRNQHLGNFAALLVSAAAASVAPLQVFLFVYAFIGPLHYLTEIAWLKKKNFYFGSDTVQQRAYVAIAVLLGVAVSVDFYIHRGLTGYAIGILIVLSLGAIVKNPLVLGAAMVAGFAAKFFVPGLVLFVGAILPTIVHVYIFTMLFMISGLLRQRRQPKKDPSPKTDRTEWLGLLNPVLLVALPVVLLAARWSYPAPAEYWIHAESGFAALHGYLARLLGQNLHPDATIMTNAGAAGVIRVLAFIYLFHYLNWFLKTELLEWHKVSRRSWVWIVGLYTISVGCYLWNFAVGFYLINFLSMLHVFLEFPLNWHTGRSLAASVVQAWSRPEHKEVVAA